MMIAILASRYCYFTKFRTALISRLSHDSRPVASLHQMSPLPAVPIFYT